MQRGESPRIQVKDAADDIEPPDQVADIHNRVFDWHAECTAIEEALAARADVAPHTDEGWTALSESPAMAAYWSALSEGRQACLEFQGRPDATEERGVFTDTPRLPGKMKEVVERARLRVVPRERRGRLPLAAPVAEPLIRHAAGRRSSRVGASIVTDGPSSASNKQPLWKRLLPIVIGLGVVVFLFGWVLPQFIDYEAVFRAIGKISWLEWIVLLVVAAVRFIPEGWIYIAAQPGLTTSQGTKLFLVAETLSNVPPGGLDLISRYQMTRSWGFSAASSTSATIASWVFTSLSKIVLPIIAVALLAIDRIQDDDLDALALLAIVIVIVGAIGIGLVLRSAKLATWVGDFLGAIVGWAAGLFRKEVKTDFRQLVHEFRDQASEVLTTRTHLGFMAGLAARLAAFVVLLTAVRAVGIPSEEVGWTIIFAAFAVVMTVSVIPIFNLPGITEVILISTLSQYAGSEFADEIAAAVFVYRILTWLLPVPLGGFAFTRWRDEVVASGNEDILDAFAEAKGDEG